MPVFFDNCARVDIVQMMSGNVIDNTLYFRLNEEEPPWTYGLLLDLVDNYMYPAFSGSNWTSTRVNSWSTVMLRATSLDAAALSYERTSGLPVFGASSGTCSNQQALVISFYTAENSRSGRGRNFNGGISNAVLSNNLWNSAVTTAITDFYTNLRQAAVLGGYTQVVASTTSAGAPRAEGVTFDVINNVPRVIPGSMATRRIGRGA